MPLLEAIAITKSFSGVQALKGVSFDLRAGEVHALVGENGAGKSTLIKIMSGALAPDSGTLAVEGRAVAHHSPAVARSLGIAAVYQQPSLFPHLTVMENIALSLESGGLWRRLDWKARAAKAKELLELAGSDLHPEQLVETLSMPEQQIVEIAKAIGANLKVLILDEPTASLTAREVDRLFGVVASLRDRGTGIIYISHRLEEISAIAGRVTVLRDGNSVATRSMGEVDRAELIRLMVGREISAIFPKREAPAGDVVLEARAVGSRAAGVRGVSLEVRAGEIVGLAGLVGSGRTQFAETLFGLTPADAGEVLLRGRAVRIGSPAAAIRLGIGYVPEDRRQHGVVLEMAVAENATLANLEAVAPRGVIDARLERELARGFVESLRIKTPSIYTEAGLLSGGNQQKVALARWLAIKPVGADPGRADAGRGRGLEIRDPRAHGRPGRGGRGDSHDLFGAARDPGDERPHRRDARGHGGRRALARRMRRSRGSWGWRSARGPRREAEPLPPRNLAGGCDCGALRRAGAGRAGLLHRSQPAGCDHGQPAGADRGAGDDAGDPHRADRYLGGIAVRDLQRGGGSGCQGGAADAAGGCRRMPGRRGHGRGQRRAGGVRADSVDRGDAGLDGGAARRAAMDHAGRVGAWTCRPASSGSGARSPPASGSPWRLPTLLVLAIAWGLRNLAAGRAVYATGSNAAAARLAGIDPVRVVFSGAGRDHGRAHGSAGAVQLGALQPDSEQRGDRAGAEVIAAVIVGGTAVTGGRGTVLGTVLGVVLLGMIGPALIFLGISA